MDAKIDTLVDLVGYQEGSVVSRKILGASGGNVTLFAFARGEGLTEHSSPYDAMVVILDGSAEIRIADRAFQVAAGETITLPANVPHALKADRPFKMMLVMIREG
jgi:quercetin dioxygenase-like cupin family protein